MKLTINLATRGRPELVTETILRTAGNIHHPETIFMVSADDDDLPTIDAFDRLRREIKLKNLRIDVRPREDSLGAKYNRCISTAPADVYLAMVDYAPHVTPGFDAKILEAAAQFPDGIGVVYNDLNDLNFPGVNGVTAKLVEGMGFLYPPHFPFWFIDHWLDDVARMIGRIAYTDVMVNISRSRPVTQNKRDLAFWCEFFTRTAALREDQAARIIGASSFVAPEWQKRMMIGAFPLVRQRSAIWNGVIARDAMGQPECADNLAHERLRAAAAKIIADLGEKPIQQGIAITATLYDLESANELIGKINAMKTHLPAMAKA